MEDLEDFTIDLNIEKNQSLRQAINQEIEKSRKHILELKKNWDGEGSPAFLEIHWKRAVNILKSIMVYFWVNFQQIIKAPMIIPVADGTIDISWQTPESDTTINIPKDTNAVPCFYGKDQSGDEIQGSMTTEKLLRVILPWLKMFQ